MQHVSKMSQQSDEDVQVEIQRTLAAINDVTLKIKKELMAITDLVREKGRLNSAVNDANEVLFSVAQEMGIDMAACSADGEKNDESENILLPITSNLITQKILSLLDESEAQSH